MRWFRSNIRWGATGALFALAIQLVLSFGHVHFAAAAAQSQPASLAQLADTPDGAGGSKHKPPPSDGVCDICILIHLAGTSTPAVAPVLPQPVNFSAIRRAIRIDRSLIASRLALFRARAPPLA